MTSRVLQTFSQYRYSARGVLMPGDRFRVKGGPVYVTDDGKVFPMRERRRLRLPLLLHTRGFPMDRSVPC